MRDDIEVRAADAVANGLLKALLSDGKRARLRVPTSSMQPGIRPGDEIVLKACRWTALRAGDVIVCERDGILQVHRFLRAKIVDGEPRLVTKGDASWHFDSPLPVDRLVGRVEQVERNGHRYDLMGGWRRAWARFAAAASAMKAHGAQIFRQFKRRTGLAAMLGLALSALCLSSASAAVSVSSFGAEGGQGQITLTWVTATELKNFGFNIERSVNSADASSWTKIAFVQSQSPCIQSLDPLTYSYTDSGLPAGAKYYYRLQLFGSPCGDPNVYHETIVSAVSSGAPTPTPTATSVPPTATAAPTATRTPVPTATATSTSIATNAAPTNTPVALLSDTPAASTLVPTLASASATPMPKSTAVPASGVVTATPAPTDEQPMPGATITVVAVVVPTTAASAPRANPPAQRRPTPTEPAVAASPSPTLVGVGVLAVLGMGMVGFGLLAIAGVVLWQYYLRR